MRPAAFRLTPAGAQKRTAYRGSMDAFSDRGGNQMLWTFH
jgi:hypothetical protein